MGEAHLPFSPWATQPTSPPQPFPPLFAPHPRGTHRPCPPRRASPWRPSAPLRRPTSRTQATPLCPNPKAPPSLDLALPYSPPSFSATGPSTQSPPPRHYRGHSPPQLQRRVRPPPSRLLHHHTAPLHQARRARLQPPARSAPSTNSSPLRHLCPRRRLLRAHGEHADVLPHPLARLAP